VLALIAVIASSVSDEATQFLVCRPVDCFAEPVIRRRFAPTRWLAMTKLLPPYATSESVGTLASTDRLRPFALAA
jgi:hypothetical protein